jgi:hypothetical protein
MLKDLFNYRMKNLLPLFPSNKTKKSRAFADLHERRRGCDRGGEVVAQAQEPKRLPPAGKDRPRRRLIGRVKATDGSDRVVKVIRFARPGLQSTFARTR